MHYILQAIVEGQGGSIQLCCAFGNQQTFAKAKLASQLTAAEFEVIAVPVRKYAPVLAHQVVVSINQSIHQSFNVLGPTGGQQTIKA